MTNHIILLRDDRQLLEHLFADAPEWLTATTLPLAGVEFIDNLDTGQVRRQRVRGLLAPALMGRHINLVRSCFLRYGHQQFRFVEQLELIRVYLRAATEPMDQQTTQALFQQLDLPLLADDLFTESIETLFSGITLLLALIGEPLFAIKGFTLLFDDALLLLEQCL